MKIKIKDKSFPTTQYGYMEANKEYDLPEHFALYCVKKMKSAEFVDVQKKQVRRNNRKAK